jgi:uncharacterized protein YraI
MRRLGWFVVGCLLTLFIVLATIAVLRSLNANPVCAAGGGDSTLQSSDCLPPSLSPSITPATLRIGGSATVSVAGLNVRAGAGTNFKIVAFLKRGTLVTIVAGPRRANGYAWYEIRFGSPAKLGWVAIRYLTPVAAPVKTAAPTPVGAYCVTSVVGSAGPVTAYERVNTRNSDQCYSHWTVTIHGGTTSFGLPCGVTINGVPGSIGNGNIWNIVTWSVTPSLSLTDAYLADGRIIVLTCATVTRNEPQVTLYRQDWF